MNDTLEQDIQLTHSFLNYLSAGYQGAFASFNAFKQLGYRGFKPDSLTRIEQILSKIERWAREMYEGHPLLSLSWTTVESFDAQAAFDALTRLRAELLDVVDEVKSILRRRSAGSVPEEAMYLVAEFARFAYSRDNYIRGYLFFAEAFNRTDIATSYVPLVEQCEADVALSNDLFTKYQQQGETIDQQFADSLLAYSVDLPIIFQTQIHEMTILLSVYSKSFTYDSIGINPQEALRWQQANIAPIDSGYWRAHEIGPEEATAWQQGGVTEGAVAYSWRNEGFNPPEVLQWLELGFSPSLARAWANHNISPQNAAAFIQQGITDPGQARNAAK